MKKGHFKSRMSGCGSTINPHNLTPAERLRIERRANNASVQTQLNRVAELRATPKAAALQLSLFTDAKPQMSMF